MSAMLKNEIRGVKGKETLRQASGKWYMAKTADIKQVPKPILANQVFF